MAVTTTDIVETRGELLGITDGERPRLIDWMAVDGLRQSVLSFADMLRDRSLRSKLRETYLVGFQESLHAFEDAFGQGDEVTITFPSTFTRNSNSYDRLFDDPRQARAEAQVSGSHSVTFPREAITARSVLSFPQGALDGFGHDFHPVIDLRIRTAAEIEAARLDQSTEIKDLALSGIIEAVSLGQWHRFPLEDATFTIVAAHAPHVN